MMMFPILIALFLQFQRLNCQAVDANGVSLYEKMERMERLLLKPQGLQFAVDPCDRLLDGNPASGQQSSAEWVRITFHDVATANVSAGTGGLDASIGFESDRAENIGVHFINATLGTFKSAFSVFTPMSDVIALGLTVSLVSCDPNPRLIKLRVGRKDALEAGPPGVPEPQDDLEKTLASFARAGFSQTEAIASVACGHSLGSVFFADFPNIVDPSVVTLDNTDGADSFDSTKAVFDNTGVIEYLDNVGKRGGPLVIGHNVTTRSDLRLFSSDGNATIRALRPAQAFQDRCYTLFEKMINTVPRGVVLSDVVVPRTWTMAESHLDLSSSGIVSFKGQFTYLYKTGSPPASASYFYSTAGGGNTGPKTTSDILDETPIRGFGNIRRYSFNDQLNSPSINGISVMGSYTAPINLNLFIIVSQSFTGFSPTVGNQAIIRAAVLSTLAPTGATLTATLYYGEPQIGSTTPKLVKTTVSLTSQKVAGSYKIFQGVINYATADLSAEVFADVKLGTTQTSAKVSRNLFGLCEDPVMTNC